MKLTGSKQDSGNLLCLREMNHCLPYVASFSELPFFYCPFGIL